MLIIISQDFYWVRQIPDDQSHAKHLPSHFEHSKPKLVNIILVQEEQPDINELKENIFVNH
jgi:hypothetical protein